MAKTIKIRITDEQAEDMMAAIREEMEKDTDARWSLKSIEIDFKSFNAQIDFESKADGMMQQSAKYNESWGIWEEPEDSEIRWSIKRMEIAISDDQENTESNIKDFIKTIADEFEMDYKEIKIKQ